MGPIEQLVTKVREQLVKPTTEALSKIKSLNQGCEQIAQNIVANNLNQLTNKKASLHDRILVAKDAQEKTNIRLKDELRWERQPENALTEFDAFENAKTSTFEKIEKFVNSENSLISKAKKLRQRAPKEYQESIKLLPLIGQVTINALTSL